MHIFGITVVLLIQLVFLEARSKAVMDVCNRQPTINGLCVGATLGIYYDAEIQRCKYMGCSTNKKVFASLEDCEKICNSKRHRRRRVHS